MNSALGYLGMLTAIVCSALLTWRGIQGLRRPGEVTPHLPLERVGILGRESDDAVRPSGVRKIMPVEPGRRGFPAELLPQ